MLKKEFTVQTPAFNLTKGISQSAASPRNTPTSNIQLPFNYQDVDYIISLDGGGSSTALQVMNADLEILELAYEGTVATSIYVATTNISIVGIDAVINTLQNLLAKVRVGSNLLAIKDLPSKALIAGIAGLGANADKIPQIQSMLNSFGLHNSNVYLASDIELLKQLIDKQGAVVISGTGSICFSKFNEQEVRIGGMGYILGDEGSAFHLGKLALQKSLEARFAGDEPFILTGAICQALGVTSIEQAMRPIYESALKPADIAKIALLVLDAAFGNDQSCRELINEYVASLAELIRTAVQASTYPNFPIYLWGGMFESVYADNLIKMLTEQVAYQYGLEFINIAHQNLAVQVLQQANSSPKAKTEKRVNQQLATNSRQNINNFPIMPIDVVQDLALHNYDYQACDYIVTIYENAFNTVLQVVNNNFQALELEYNGTISSMAYTNNIDMNAVGLPVVLDILEQLLANVKVGAQKLSIAEIANKTVICGLAGLMVDLDSRKQVKKIFAKFNFVDEHIYLASHIEMLKPLIAQKGAVLIADTGSLCCSHSNGKDKNFGGLGYILGDEGSGFYIGKLALQKALAAKYANKKPFILTNEICTLFKIKSIEEIVKPVYERVIKPTDIAKLAPMVLDAAFKHNDHQSLLIVDKAIYELAKLVKLALQDSTEPNFEVYVDGGVFDNEHAVTLLNMLEQKVGYQYGLKFINLAKENIIAYVMNKQFTKSPRLGLKG